MKIRMTPHRPHRYSYVVAYPGYRMGWNRYGLRVIGAYVVLGKIAYCVKWAWSR